MNIETVDELCEHIADLIGVYGSCKHSDETHIIDGEEIRVDECNEECDTCCRVGFMMVMPDRIRQAVENDKILESLNHQTP